MMSGLEGHEPASIGHYTDFYCTNNNKHEKNPSFL